MTEASDRIVAEAMRQARDNAIDAAIEICEMMTGHSAECCVAALRDFKDNMRQVAPVPSKMQ